MNQIALPSSTTLLTVDLARERTLGGAIELCAKVGGYAYDKELSGPLGFDKGQLSRWQSNQEGIIWDKLIRLMDFCGNHAPVLWMLYQLGYDLNSLRKRESELEKQVRERDEKIVQLETRLSHFEDFVRIAK
jgi:plasmid maintenance system antidote protein VapI